MAGEGSQLSDGGSTSHVEGPGLSSSISGEKDHAVAVEETLEGHLQAEY